MKGKYIFGAGLIIFGVLMMIQQFGFIHIGNIWDYWPLLIIGAGVVHLSNNRHSIITGLSIISIGTVFQLDQFGWIDFWDIFLPLLLVIIGLSMIIKKSKKPEIDEQIGENLKVSVAFSGVKETISNRNFKGGTISVAFGGAEIDLRGANISQDGAQIELNVAFGGVELYVPPNWEIIIIGTPIFGDIKNKSYPIYDLNMIKPKLVLNSSVAFGGVEIKS